MDLLDRTVTQKMGGCYYNFTGMRQTPLLLQDLVFLNGAEQLLMRDDPGRDAHRLQLLEQQLIRIRNLNRRELCRVSTPLTVPDTLFWIHDGNQAAILTTPTAEQVGTFHKALLCKLGDTVRHDAIALHFTKAKTTLTRTPLSRLPSEHYKWTRRSGMHLVRRAMPQSLIEARTHKDTRLHLTPRVAIIENLIPRRLQPKIIAHNLCQPL